MALLVSHQRHHRLRRDLAHVLMQKLAHAVKSIVARFELALGLELAQGGGQIVVRVHVEATGRIDHLMSGGGGLDVNDLALRAG